MATVLEKQEQKAKPERAKRTRLYPPTNPYALVAVALDIRPVISSMVSLLIHVRVYIIVIFRMQVEMDTTLLNLLVINFRMI